MLKVYKNQFYKAIEDIGLTPSEFKFRVENKEDVIMHDETGFEFRVIHSSESYNTFRCRFSQFQPTAPLSIYFPNYYIQFPDMIKRYFFPWVKEQLKPRLEELNGIDLWEEYSKGSQVLDLDKIDFDDKSPFSYDEQKQIALALDDLKLLVASKFELTQEQNDNVIARLDYLTEACSRMNKFDWKSLLMNMIVSIIVALSFDTAKGAELFSLVKHVFSTVNIFKIK